MKIAIFTNNYLPNPFGVSGSVESFRKEFERLGHEVYIFAPLSQGYQDRNPHVFRYPSKAIEVKKIKYPLPVPYSHKIWKILENLEIDIIHSQHPNLLGSAAARLAKRKNIPLVFTWHTLYDQYAHFAPMVPKGIAAWWAIRNARNYANKCDAVVVPTPSIIKIIKKWGVTNENITAIPTGVEEDQFKNPDRESIRKKYGITENEILLFVQTRLTAEKNMEFLTSATLEMMKKNDLVKFLIGGDGDKKIVLEKMVKKAQLGERVIFASLISAEGKKDYFAAGDIFVYASKSETQGMTISEAMYSGLPIVAVRATGVQDLVEDGRTGFLVSENQKEFSDAVQKLIDDKDMRMKFGKEAARVAREKYTSKVCAEKMLSVYESAIERKVQSANLKTTT